MNKDTNLTRESKKYLLSLARRAIEAAFGNEAVTFGTIPEEVKMNSGSFVTLTLDSHLRGCVGMLEAVEPLFKSVASNAVKAAFEDSRFPPVPREEFARVLIEISRIRPMRVLRTSGPNELVEKLTAEKPGVLLSLGSFRATYLPQVWVEIPDAPSFLSSLCMKAGLSSHAWRESFRDMQVHVYSVELFKE